MFPRHPSQAGNQSAGDLATALGNQQGGRGISDQPLDVIWVVGGTCVLTPRLSP